MVDVIPADQTPHCLASVDAVILNGNTTAHLRQAREVASAHVACFIEKPLGRTEDEALVVAATLRDVPTATGFFLHHVPAVARFLELLAAPPVHASFTFGHDGRRRGVFDGDASWMVDPRSGGSGSFVDLGIHLTHLIDLVWTNMGVEVIDTEFDSATDGLSDSSGRASLHVGAAEIDVEAPGRPNGSVAWDRWGHFCTPASHATEPHFGERRVRVIAETVWHNSGL